MMKFRDSPNGKAQREKLQSDFLNFNNAGISPTKQCFYEKGYEYLDVSSRNMYVSYAVSTTCQISMQGPQLCKKPHHFFKLDVATSRMAFFDLNLHVYILPLQIQSIEGAL